MFGPLRSVFCVLVIICFGRIAVGCARDYYNAKPMEEHEFLWSVLEWQHVVLHNPNITTTSNDHNSSKNNQIGTKAIKSLKSGCQAHGLNERDCPIINGTYVFTKPAFVPVSYTHLTLPTIYSV